MAQMSSSYIGSDALTSAVTPITVPGFDVLQPYSYASTSPSTTPATSSNAPASTTTSGDGLNQYQQAVANLESWQNQILQASLSGDTSGATSALYASAGLNADEFANLAYQLEQLGANESGGTVDTSA
jgi:hypothetical protein